jgi:hypothetical protein
MTLYHLFRHVLNKRENLGNFWGVLFDLKITGVQPIALRFCTLLTDGADADVSGTETANQNIASRRCKFSIEILSHF